VIIHLRLKTEEIHENRASVTAGVLAKAGSLGISASVWRRRQFINPRPRLKTEAIHKTKTGLNTKAIHKAKTVW